MADTTQLDAFLKGDVPVAEPVAEPATKPDATEAAAAAPAKPAEPAAKVAEPDDAEPPEPREGEALVPRRAYEDERHKRQDWKARAVEAETQRADLQRQLAEAKQPPATAQPPPVLQPIDPAVDPQGYANRVQGMMVNERLNLSEMLVTKELGAEKVAEISGEFKEAAKADPSLFQKLYAQPHPYEWASKQVERMRMQKEIGDDPAAYRARIIAEHVAAAGNGAAATVPVSPAAGMAPSLASARSVAGRSEPAYSGPLAMDDILAGIHGRNNAKH
jgi:hypothetical protein